MQIGTKFSISIHILLCAEFFKDKRKVTSGFLAESVKTNPVVIRKLMGLLKESGLIEIAAGTGGIRLKRPADKITFLDIFNAAESVKDGKLFKVHNTVPNDCPVAQKINFLLDDYFFNAQTVLEKKLNSYTLKDIFDKIKNIECS